MKRVFLLVSIVFLLTFTLNSTAATISVKRAGVGVSNDVAGTASDSSYSNDGGFLINPSYWGSGTDAEYKFLLPNSTLYGSMTNLRVSVYGKGKNLKGEPALYAGGVKLIM